jgi:hypothetical protein
MDPSLSVCVEAHDFTALGKLSTVTDINSNEPLVRDLALLVRKWRTVHPYPNSFWRRSWLVLCTLEGEVGTDNYDYRLKRVTKTSFEIML